MTPPSIEPSFFLKLKVLPKHLKYVYPGEQEICHHNWISFTDGEEENIMSILRKNREVIGWIMTDIKGLSTAIVQHHIYLNEEVTPKRDPQRRLNPIM